MAQAIAHLKYIREGESKENPLNAIFIFRANVIDDYADKLGFLRVSVRCPFCWFAHSQEV